MRRFRLAAGYPFLWALVPVLYLASSSPGYVTVGDLLVVSAVMLAFVAVIYGAAALAFGRGADWRLPALIAGLAVLGFFEFDPVARSLPRLPHHGSFVLLGLVWLPASIALVLFLKRRAALLRTLSTFLAITGALLVAREAFGIVAGELRSREELAHSPLARSLARPVPGPLDPGRPARDVYVIVLDEYANADVLREVFGFDNSPFLDSLRALGFYVPRAVTSNYGHTTLSLPSLLNAAHVYPAALELPRGSSDPTLMNELLDHSRIARFFQARGYRYLFFPSMWWGATRTSPIADSVVDVWPQFSLRHELSRTEFRRTIRRTTVLDYVFRDEPQDGEFVKRTLEQAGRLPSLAGPVFAFVHVLSPHWPYVFDRSCHLTPRGAIGSDHRPGYIGQLQCLDSLVLATVHRLIRDSDVPPVIVLQGDHGSLMLAHWMKGPRADVEKVPAEAAWERLGAFGAYYLPDGGARAFGDSVTVVNVLGNVVRYYFGATLPSEPDEHYLSVGPAPFQFRHVDPAWLASWRSQRPLATESAR